ncbi:hypothetical protein NDU88_004850 [Pleurodeles waltl]|uniref:Uncharacterized protein n=1 Tax=Pleurodeles waltl TaxID=8319 RepID=A0AAV7LL43_PLEWA|nr:hypothetical protein NDU88_004850 [Pleurodeles waltl]
MPAYFCILCNLRLGDPLRSFLRREGLPMSIDLDGVTIGAAGPLQGTDLRGHVGGLTHGLRARGAGAARGRGGEHGPYVWGTACRTAKEPDEVWAWLEAYHKGHIDVKPKERKRPRRRSKRRHARESQQDCTVMKPTSQQAHQGKRAALRAVASLAETRSSEEGLRSDLASLN